MLHGLENSIKQEKSNIILPKAEIVLVILTSKYQLWFGACITQRKNFLSTLIFTIYYESAPLKLLL
jgi:hypothetical protein